MLRIITLGSKNEPWVEDGIAHYSKRLKPPFDIKWILLRAEEKDGARARQIDSQTILKRVKEDDFVILLDELGEFMTSRQFSNYLDQKFINSAKIVFIIGGSYGVDTVLTQRANKIITLSTFVFPHHLVRLILTEQIYRAQEIHHGNPYHHG